MNALRQFFQRDAVKGVCAILGALASGASAAALAAVINGPTWVRILAASGAFVAGTVGALGVISGGTTNLQPPPKSDA